MTDSAYNRLAKISVLLSIAVPVSLFVALGSLPHPKNFFQVSIVCQYQEDCDKQWTELTRAHSEPIRHAHTEMVALTVLAVALLLFCFLFTRSGNPKWATHLLITSVVASLAACLLQW